MQTIIDFEKNTSLPFIFQLTVKQTLEETVNFLSNSNFLLQLKFLQTFPLELKKAMRKHLVVLTRYSKRNKTKAAVVNLFKVRGVLTDWRRRWLHCISNSPPPNELMDSARQLSLKLRSHLMVCPPFLCAKRPTSAI